MLCEICHSNQATIRLTVKSKKGLEEKWVCKSCATDDVNMSPHDDIEDTFVIKQILQHLATKHGIELNRSHKAEKRCPTCDMTLKDIAQRGKFGCPNCYQTFRDDILDIVRRVQGGQLTHQGKVPKSSHEKLAIKRQIDEKTTYLSHLIDVQNFEEAAVVRDEINALKAKSEGDDHES